MQIQEFCFAAVQVSLRNEFQSEHQCIELCEQTKAQNLHNSVQLFLPTGKHEWNIDVSTLVERYALSSFYQCIELSTSWTYWSIMSEIWWIYKVKKNCIFHSTLLTILLYTLLNQFFYPKIQLEIIKGSNPLISDNILMHYSNIRYMIQIIQKIGTDDNLACDKLKL